MSKSSDHLYEYKSTPYDKRPWFTLPYKKYQLDDQTYIKCSFTLFIVSIALSVLLIFFAIFTVTDPTLMQGFSYDEKPAVNGQTITINIKNGALPTSFYLFTQDVTYKPLALAPGEVVDTFTFTGELHRPTYLVVRNIYGMEFFYELDAGVEATEDDESILR